MGVAARTGLPCFTGRGETIYAAKITGMETDQETGYTIISFGEIDKQTLAMPKWVGENQPDIGGYFVVTDKGLRSHGRFMPAAEFYQHYTWVGS